MRRETGNIQTDSDSCKKKNGKHTCGADVRLLQWTPVDDPLAIRPIVLKTIVVRKEELAGQPREDKSGHSVPTIEQVEMEPLT